MLKPSWHQPLLGLLQCVPPPLLLQPPPSLLQLGEGVRSWVGGHGWVLDERVRGLDLGGRWAREGGRHRGGVVTQLGRDPGVHSSRSLHWSGTWWLAAGCRPPGATGAATGKQRWWEMRWSSKDLSCPHWDLCQFTALKSRSQSIWDNVLCSWITDSTSPCFLK